jgi:hypothetical protein
MQFPQPSHHFISFLSKYSPQYPVHKHPQPMFLLKGLHSVSMLSDDAILQSRPLSAWYRRPGSCPRTLRPSAGLTLRNLHQRSIQDADAGLRHSWLEACCTAWHNTRAMLI